jgi:acetyl-CoA synthetase
VAAEVVRWSREELGAELNEFYGLTEVNHLIGNCSALWPVKEGRMGLPYPGREVALLDASGEPAGVGVEGQIAVRRGDPTGFLGYWENPEKTQAMLHGDWIRTGDLAVRDEDGYFWFVGRGDDLIKSAGYRVGPSEVEEVLLELPEVAEAAVIAAPDPIRGSAVKALIRLAPDVAGSEELKTRIQTHVRERLAAFKYPRIVEFVDRFPLTTTGKIDRKLLRERERQAAEGGGPGMDDRAPPGGRARHYGGR